MKTTSTMTNNTDYNRITAITGMKATMTTTMTIMTKMYYNDNQADGDEDDDDDDDGDDECISRPLGWRARARVSD